MTKPRAAVPPAQRVLARLTGARLCFGRPVEFKGRTVIPVASVRTAGGYGFGDGAPSAGGSGGGGGGALDARPVGFIEIGPDGTRFERIDDGRMALRAIAGGTFAVLVAGRVLMRRRRVTIVRGDGRRRAVSTTPPTAAVAAPARVHPSRIGALARLRLPHLAAPARARVLALTQRGRRT